MPVCPIDGCGIYVDGSNWDAHWATHESPLPTTASVPVPASTFVSLPPVQTEQLRIVVENAASRAYADNRPIPLLAERLEEAGSSACLAVATTRHFRTQRGSDASWGCGYRNVQMAMSAMAADPAYQARIPIPRDIEDIQRYIESAWLQGFDAPGAMQLNGRVLGTKTWIGATEAYTLLCGLGIKSTVIDFHRPATNVPCKHTYLLDWVFDYFGHPSSTTPSEAYGRSRVQQTKLMPLYLQHQGHSRTIIGVDKSTTGRRFLLLLDPGLPLPPTTKPTTAFLSAYRCGLAELAKYRQYQLVRIDPPNTPVTAEDTLIRSVRVPA